MSQIADRLFAAECAYHLGVSLDNLERYAERFVEFLSSGDSAARRSILESVTQRPRGDRDCDIIMKTADAIAAYVEREPEPAKAEASPPRRRGRRPRGESRIQGE